MHSTLVHPCNLQCSQSHTGIVWSLSSRSEFCPIRKELESFCKCTGQHNFPQTTAVTVSCGAMPNSPLSGTGVVCSSHRFCTQAAPYTVNVSGRTVRKGTSRTGRAEGWTCWFRVAITAAPKLQHPYSAPARSPNAARQQQSLAARGAERWELAEEAGVESTGRRAGLSLDSRRLHWNIVEGEPSKSYHPTKTDWPLC